MAVKRQKNWLGQQRVDVPHLREIESAIVADFDELAGKILASSRPIVVNGMTISMGAAVGNFASSLVLNTAGSILLHGTASEPGALFVVPTTQAAETLNTSNTSVVGSFTPNTTNYIGIDLIRQIDATTSDTVKFRSATTKKEFSQDVPLARVLQYRVIISTNDFSLQPNVAPVAKVVLNSGGVVTSVTDCRELMFRLGSGGSTPNALAVYPWTSRVENPVTSTTTSDPFTGADKSIASFIDFFHAMESRLWEVGGGEHWYSQTTDRDVLFVRDASNVFSNGENFEWTGTNLHWKGISFDFGNSTAVKNTINQQLTDSAGLTDLAVGQCLYVDVNRATDLAALTMVKANLSSLGTPVIPGSRQIIAWRVSEGIYARGSVFPVGASFAHATATTYGIVKLYQNVGTDAVVLGVDSGGRITVAGVTATGSGANVVVSTLSTGTGFYAISALDSSTQVTSGAIKGETSNGKAIHGKGTNAGYGGYFETVSGGNAVYGTTDSGAGATGISGTGTGVIGTSTSHIGVSGTSSGAQAGVHGSSSSGPGVNGISTSGPGIKATGNATRAPLNLVPLAAPSTPSDGDIWVETTSNVIKARVNGATRTIATDLPDTITPSAGTGWTLTNVIVRRMGSFVTVNAHATVNNGATASFNTIFTLPSGSWPVTANLSAMGSASLSATTYPARFFIQTSNGQTGLDLYDNGTSLVTPPAPVTNDFVLFSATFSVA